MNPPPTYVAIVLPPFVQLHAVSAASRERIASAGLRLERNGGYQCVRFADTHGPILSNQSLVDTLKRLNRAGILFAEDYKQGWAPADLMREFQSTGQSSEAFTSIAWRAKDDWFTAQHEPNRNA